MRRCSFLNLKKSITIITKSLWDFFGFLSHFNALKFSPGHFRHSAQGARCKFVQNADLTFYSFGGILNTEIEKGSNSHVYDYS